MQRLTIITALLFVVSGAAHAVSTQLPTDFATRISPLPELINGASHGVNQQPEIEPLQTDPLQMISQAVVTNSGNSGISTSGKSSVTAMAVLNGKTWFNNGAASMTATGQQALRKLIDQLSDYSNIISIRVIGHTDNVGSREFNRVLSEKRAEGIAAVFKQRLSGARAATKISAFGAGEDEPVSSNDTAEGRASNRRVEIQVLALGQAPVIQ